MKILKLTSTVIALALSTNINAAVIYNFTSTCTSGCTGQAFGELVLADTYTPGTNLVNTDFISFSYESSSGSFSVPNEWNFNRISGVLPEISGYALEYIELDFVEDNTGLHAFTDGTWDLEFAPFGTDYNITLDAGNSMIWTTAPVPVPAAVWLFGSGLIGLIGFAKRKAS